MKTIAILSQKGGSGKTTLALHLAVVAQQDDKLAVIADLDEQASATMWHKARENPEPHVQPTHSAALPSLIEAAEAQGVDFLILDTAPQSDKPAINAAEVADIILITCKPSIMDLRAIQNTIRLIKIASLKANANAYVVLTQIEAQGTLHEEARDTLKKLDVNVLPFGLGRRVAYHHGLISGETALEYEPTGKAAQEIRSLYKHICHLASMPSSSHEESHVSDKTKKA